jgi:hypothetical protein
MVDHYPDSGLSVAGSQRMPDDLVDQAVFGKPFTGLRVQSGNGPSACLFPK